MNRKKIPVFNIFNYSLMSVLILIFAVPYAIILASSLSTESSLAYHGYVLFPREFSLNAYKYIFTSNTYFVRSIFNSVYMTVVGTILATVVTVMYSYAVSRSRLPGKGFFNNFAIFTMLFGGGLVPYYLLVTGIGLKDSLWAIILPATMQAWNMILIRNYLYGIPDSLEESAKIDGATPYGVLFRIYFPLIKPVIATVVLFSAVGFWNNWYGPLLFIESKEKYPIQYLVRDMLNQLAAINSDPGGGASQPGAVPLISTRMAAIVVASLPIIAVYPFLQKYFIHGAILGAVKE